MLNARARAVLAVTLGGAALATGAAAATATPPVIVANPNSVMVNGKTTLTGSGFAPLTVLHLQECGAANWIAPQNPCDTTNEVTVATNLHGGFTTTFKMLLCPRVGPIIGPVTQETCYVGVPKPSGIDTIQLQGAAKITVTYP